MQSNSEDNDAWPDATHTLLPAKGRHIPAID
jgi:hypothetical protein